MVEYSDDSRRVGSAATLSCDNGYVFSGLSSDVEVVMRTCSEQEGWSGEDVTCERKFVKDLSCLIEAVMKCGSNPRYEMGQRYCISLLGIEFW